MGSPTISIIIPVYNVKQYLRECVESVLSQSFTDHEILLVDDGSKDGSSEICDELSLLDKRIKVFHKVNGGVSSARNLGLDNARGRWVIFLDADDHWVNDTILQILGEELEEKDLDILRGEYLSVNENGEIIYYSKTERKEKYQNKVLSSGIFLKNIINGEFFLPLSLIKRSIIGDRRFDENMIFFEDGKFYMTLLNDQLKCGYINNHFYAYRKISSSASNNVSIKKLEDSFAMCDFFWNMAAVSKNVEYSEYCRFYSVMMYYWTLQTVASPQYFGRRNKIINELELKKLNERVVERLNYTNISKKYWLFVKLPPRASLYMMRIKDSITGFIGRINKAVRED